MHGEQHVLQEVVNLCTGHDQRHTDHINVNIRD